MLLNVIYIFFKINKCIVIFFAEHYDLENPDEKYDIIPEIWEGHNIADYVDPEIFAVSQYSVNISSIFHDINIICHIKIFATALERRISLKINFIN